MSAIGGLFRSLAPLTGATRVVLVRQSITFLHQPPHEGRRKASRSIRRPPRFYFRQAGAWLVLLLTKYTAMLIIPATRVVALHRRSALGLAVSISTPTRGAKVFPKRAPSVGWNQVSNSTVFGAGLPVLQAGVSISIGCYSVVNTIVACDELDGPGLISISNRTRAGATYRVGGTIDVSCFYFSTLDGYGQPVTAATPVSTSAPPCWVRSSEPDGTWTGGFLSQRPPGRDCSSGCWPPRLSCFDFPHPGRGTTCRTVWSPPGFYLGTPVGAPTGSRSRW